MPALPNLPLRRVPEYELNRKKSGRVIPPAKNFSSHSAKIQSQVNETLEGFKEIKQRSPFDPSLILRVETNAEIDEDEWRRAGLTIVGRNEDKTLVLFSSDGELQSFKERLSKYESGPIADQKNAPYNGFFSSIESVGRMGPQDRIGRLLIQAGIRELNQFVDEQPYVLDVELWHTGNLNNMRSKLQAISEYIRSLGSRVTDAYLGNSLAILRIKTIGAIAKLLLHIDDISMIDLPPKVSLETTEKIDYPLDAFQPVPRPAEDSPGICILDSGLASGHPMLAPAVGEATSVPQQVGDPTDNFGHGTFVAGLALYGDVNNCIDQRLFVPTLKLFSARVLNDAGGFDDESLITSQMVQAIKHFKDNHGCRVFNISLGDVRLPYDDKKVSPWASILDDLSRQEDVVIIVSAGNYHHYLHSTESEKLHYPTNLLTPSARIIEPATGAIVLTVGSLARSESVAADDELRMRPVGIAGYPSPFTRSGPGINKSIKPEVCEYGGNWATDGRTHITTDELSVISLNNEFLRGLFNTDVGTSFSAPKVAHVAARLLAIYPDASANLLRAFICHSAHPPEIHSTFIEQHGLEAALRLYGYGVPDFDRASTSEINKVTLYASNSLPHDMFHIYEVPIPEEWVSTAGERKISVALAFDPPVRHSRLDYLGLEMSFRLIRGRSVEEVAEEYRHRSNDEPDPEEMPDSNVCKMVPGPRMREGGTVQKAIFTMRNNPRNNYGDTYYLVVRSHRKWAPDELSPQRYSVVVSVEHSSAINIYAAIEVRVQQSVAIQTRLRTH